MSSTSELSSPSAGNPLTAEQVTLIRGSWRRLAPRLGEMATGFYGRLFDADPELRPMFDGVEIEAQGKKFTDTVSFVVKGLDHFELLGPAIGELGRRHVGYGVEDAHYLSIRRALLATLAAELGDAFDAETREAWEITYDALALIMKAGPTGDSMTVSALD